MKHFRINLAIFFVLISARAQAQLISDIRFPSEFAITDTCKTTMISQNITIKTSDDGSVKIYSLNFCHLDNSLFINGKQVHVLDTFVISKSKPLVVSIKLDKIPNIKDVVSLSYVYDNGEKYANGINFHFGDLVVNNNDVKLKKEQLIDFSKVCSDSLRIYFPYGGTVSSVSVYKKIDRKRIFKQVGYSHGDPENYIVFTKADKGRYYVKFSSCYWSSNFWLTIK